MKKLLLPTLIALAGAFNAVGQITISEFMASNGGTLLDEDGESSDWIELFNGSTMIVNLAGWRLTDDPENLAKWTFPSTNLAPGQFLVVFASGKNRTMAGARLHTNFELDNAGEYLALVRPDAQIASQFAPAFPPQADGISYGTEASVTPTRLITNGALARWIVPLNAGELPQDWTSTNFSDATWNTGRTALGFDAGPSNIVVGGTATNVALGKAATQSSTLPTFTANLGVDGNTANFTHTSAGQGLPATWEVSLGTNYGIERIVIFNRADCCGSRLRDITARILSLDGTATNFISALLNPENTLGGGSLNGPATLTVNLTNLTGGVVIGGRVRITRTPDPDLSGTGGQGNADEGDVLSLGEVQVFGLPAAGSFNGLIRTDALTEMRNQNATMAVRIPFLVVSDELPTLDQLTLRMNYDDGFAAFLNGVKVAEINAPASLTWNSAATAEHPDAAALVAENFDVTADAALLQEGINVLAIQGLNRTAADDDFLVLPELTGLSSGASAERYFAQPTPGAPNTGGTLGLVADTKFSADRGFYDVPFVVAITTATAGAEIRFTTNGSAPSATSGTIYTGPVLISRTTVLRAIATKPGWTPSDVDTHTYVFLSNVVAQSHTSVTNAGYPNSWAGTAADYAMDTRITSPNTAQIVPALRSLPSMFISTSISNLFDPARGIYLFPDSHGVDWERPVSIELVDTNGATEFQEDAGLRIQGGYFRQANVTQKHSLRVLFKSIYGAGRLRHDLFKAADAVTEFDGFVLRAGANDGYAWSDAKDTEQFTRDQFGRELHGSMGHPSPHGLFVHLYLNGIYWGLYNLVERANEDFSTSYFGGDPTEWDSNNAGDIKSGDLQAWNAFVSQASTATTAALYQRLQGNNLDGTRNPSHPVYLDKLNYIDYMIANIWGGNWDWPNKNFWFGRERTTNSTGFKFYMWDYENTMGNNRARSDTNMISPRAGTENTWVGQPHFYLKNNPEYRIDFADRVQRYFFDNGLLTPGVLTNRYRALADHVELSILGETARWGDDNLNPPQDIDDWRRERDWILGTYLRVRSGIVLQQFRTAGLFPNIAAPRFSQLAGTVPEGTSLELTHTNVTGVIYFTLDGSDPRQIGGAVSPTAQAYSLPLSITAPIYLRARVLSGAVWSPIIEAIFQPPQDLDKLLVTEIMYNPPALGLVDGDEFEFIELKNAGMATLNLSNLRFNNGIAFNFTNGTFLGAGQFFVLVRNASQFATKYPGVPIGGVYNGSLNNAGENVRLSAILGGTVQSIDYDDRAPWPAAADGFGFSLVPLNPNANPNPDNALNWRSSTAIGGSPGADDPPPAGLPHVVINEALTASVFPELDQIELFNPTASAADIGGWFMTDEPDTPKKFRIPTGTIIEPGGYLTYSETNFNAVPGASNSFSLRAEGDDLYLYSADANGNFTGYSHGFSFGAAAQGVTFGRHVNSVGEEDFIAQIARTLGATNAGPRVGPVVINEIMYHPQTGDDEFIELRNISGAPVGMFDPVTRTNTWRLDGLGYDFPTNVTLTADGLLLIVSTDPAAFRAKYLVPPAVTVLGPYLGALQHSGERLELQRPGPFDTNSRVSHITVDMVRYNDKAPWSPAADGSGPSLQRKNALAYGNEPLNWEAAVATPGRVFTGGTPPTITWQPVDMSVVATREAIFMVAATGPGPLFYQWRFNGLPIPGATNSTLLLTNLQPAQSGNYAALIFNEGGAVESLPAALTVLVPASIVVQPNHALVRIRPDPLALQTTNATFYAQATSTTPIRFQWQKFDGSVFANLSTATNGTLVVTNVQLADGGDYRCAITDDAGTVYTQPVKLVPLITPVVTLPPLSQTTPPGGLVSVSTMLDDGNPPPFYYEWRRGSTVIGSFSLPAKSNVFTFLAHSNLASLQYRLVVTNLAVTNLQAVTRTFNITTVADTDADGIPDEWENAYALDPATAADRNQDADGDGLSNWQEYQAGTDPLNPASYLKIQLTATPGLAQIEFNAASNKTYSVQFTETLGAGNWRRLADVMARTNNRVEFVPDSEWTSNRIYRLVTPKQP